MFFNSALMYVDLKIVELFLIYLLLWFDLACHLSFLVYSFFNWTIKNVFDFVFLDFD